MPKAKNKRKLLIVEDDQMISSMYRSKFESRGFEVLSADNGADGLTMAVKEKPVLVLLDIILPQLDGFSVLKRLKKDGRTKKIPVVMLTNLGTGEDEKKGIELGAEDYLVKANLTPGEVSKKIETYIKPGAK